MRIFLLSLIWIAAVETPILAQYPDPFSPTVSRSESLWLQESFEMAEKDPRSAMTFLEEKISEKSSAALEFSLGNIYFQAGKHGEAAEKYRAALKKFPNFRDARINLGRVYLLLERPGDAAKVYQELVRDGIADAETYQLLGHAFMMEGKSVSAETAYRHSLLLDEDGLEARQGLLNCLLDQKRYPEVLELTGELIAGDATQQAFWSARANAQLFLEEREAAARSLEQARRLGVADAEMLSMLGQLYLQEALPEEGVARLDEAFALADVPAARKEQAIRGLIELGRLEDAERMLSGIGDGADWVIPLQARLALNRGNPDEAGRLLKNGLEKEPLHGELLYLLAEVQQVRGEEDMARLTLERLSRIEGYEADALIEMARMEVDRKEWAEAVKLLERAMVFEESAPVRRYIEQLQRMKE